MNDPLEVQITNVGVKEVHQLDTMIDAMKEINYQDKVKHSIEERDYVVTVNPATIDELKKVLNVVLRYVDAEKIEIET